MKKTRLGKTELMVSQIGFGGIPIQKPSEEAAVAIVQDSLNRGINFIDTSRVYTTSEERIGKAIQGKKDRVILATKTTSRTPETVAKDLETSLEKLGTDYIDIYQLHNVSTEADLKKVLSPEGPMAVLFKAKAEGKIRHIGITSHRITVAKEAIQTGHFETVMVALNFVNTEAKDEILPLAKKLDVGVIIMKPMAGGMLENPVLSFKYLMQFPDIVPLIGISKVGEMEENLKILEGPADITPAEQKEMDKIKKELGSGFCRMCNYCQPCPRGILISAIMYTRVAITRFDPERIFNGEWDKFIEKVPDCSDCGECEKRCPYELPIRARIRQAAEEYHAAKQTWLDSKS